MFNEVAARHAMLAHEARIEEAFGPILKAGPNDMPQETNHLRGAFHMSD